MSKFKNETPADDQFASLALQKDRLRATAMHDIMQNTPWLTAEQVGKAYANLHGAPAGEAVAAHWKSQKALFCVSSEGQDWYPSYAFGADARPLPAMGRVLALLSEQDPWRLAAWFESTSSFLGGLRPRQVIAEDGERVLAAVRDRKVQSHDKVKTTQKRKEESRLCQMVVETAEGLANNGLMPLQDLEHIRALCEKPTKAARPKKKK